VFACRALGTVKDGESLTSGRTPGETSTSTTGAGAAPNSRVVGGLRGHNATLSAATPQLAAWFRSVHPSSRLPRSAVAAAMVAACAAMAACSAGGAGAQHSSTPSTRQAALASPSVSTDPVIAFGKPVHAASEGRERPLGRLAFVLEVVSQSVYEFDLGRGRFLGPSPLVQDDRGHILALPGDPTVVSSNPPQGLAASHDTLVVAGGLDGTVVEIPILPDGLGTPVSIEVPVVSVMEPSGGQTVSNASTPSGRPAVRKVVILDDSRRAVAITADTRTNTSVAYLVDLISHRVLTSRQTPHGQVNAMATDGSRIALGTSNSRLVLMDANLNTVEDIGLRGQPGALAYVKDVVVASELANGTGGSAATQLERVELPSANSAVIGVAGGGTLPGALWADETMTLWAIAGSTHLRMLENGQPAGEIALCGNIRSLAVTPDYILGTCLNGAKLGLVDRSSGRVSLLDGGGFPSAVVVRP